MYYADDEDEEVQFADDVDQCEASCSSSVWFDDVSSTTPDKEFARGVWE